MNNLTKECQGVEVSVNLYFEKLEFGTSEEQDKLTSEIWDALSEIREVPEFENYGKVIVTVEDPGKVSTVLKMFGW